MEQGEVSDAHRRVGAETFFALTQRISGGIVTSILDGRPNGAYIGIITAGSIDPPRLLVGTSKGTLTTECIESSGVLAVHPLARGQEEWFARFGLQTGRDVDKFEGVAWHQGATGAPILDEAIGFIEGRVIDSLDCGDHVARLVEPVAADLLDPGAVPLSILEIFARGLDPGNPMSPPHWIQLR